MGFLSAEPRLRLRTERRVCRRVCHADVRKGYARVHESRSGPGSAPAVRPSRRRKSIRRKWFSWTGRSVRAKANGGIEIAELRPDMSPPNRTLNGPASRRAMPFRHENRSRIAGCATGTCVALGLWIAGWTGAVRAEEEPTAVASSAAVASAPAVGSSVDSSAVQPGDGATEVVPGAAAGPAPAATAERPVQAADRKSVV